MESGQRKKALEDRNSYSQQDIRTSYRNSLFRENESGAVVKKQTYQDGCVVYFIWFDWAYTSIIIKRTVTDLFIQGVNCSNFVNVVARSIRDGGSD